MLCPGTLLWYMFDAHNLPNTDLKTIPVNYRYPRKIVGLGTWGWISMFSLILSRMWTPMFYKCLGKILSLSERSHPRARIIFRLVAIWQGFPFSILLIVKGETSAFLESSALLIRSSSLISRMILWPNLFFWYRWIFIIPYLSTLSFNLCPHSKICISFISLMSH